MRLSPEAREVAEAALCQYRRMREDLGAYGELQEDCTAAPTARWSHIGSSRGQPGNPTRNRAVRLASFAEERGLDGARRAVATVDAWRGRLHRDDRIVVALVYGLERAERTTLEEACGALGIPYGDARERQAVGEHMRGLLADLAGALGASRRPGRPRAGQREAEALAAS
ncbi:MAG: hypothetical protein KGK07_07430 [Chloroflexota bacterium]|nr:hypothetical protein [Chloroflexota bacterium]